MARPVRYLKEDRVVFMKARRKLDAIREVAAVLEEAPEISDFRRFLSSVFQKESRFGSGVGQGVAIPHYRDASLREPVIALGVSQEGIDWGDKEPVRILVLIGWPENKHAEAYLKTVAELARLLHADSVRQQVMGAETADEVIEAFKNDGVQSPRVAL